MSKVKMRHRLAILVSAAVTVACSVASADPNHEDFHAALAVYGGELSGELQQRSQALYEEANKALTDLAETANTKRASRLDSKKIGRTNVALTQLSRLAKQLRVYGEPAGVDYRLRCNVLRQNLGRIVETYRSLPSSQRFIASVRLQINKQGPVRLKALGRIEQFAVQQKWEQAEGALHDVLDTLATGTVFLNPAENRIIYEPFDEAQMAVETAMLRIRNQKALELLAAARREQTPDFGALLAEMGAATKALSTASTAPWAGELLTGPQLVGRFGQTWQEAQVAVLRCRVLDWAMAHRMVDMHEDAIVSSDDLRKSKIEGEFQQFSESLVQVLAQTVEADAQRASGDDTMRLYVEHLRAISPLVRQSDRRMLASALEPSLDKLASKSPGLAEEVAAYRDATVEVLRWRERLAAALAAPRLSRYVPVEEKFFDATKSDAEYTGLFPDYEPNPHTPVLLASAPEIMPVATQRLVGQTVTALDVVRVPGGRTAAIARYRMRTYVNTPAPLAVQAEVDALRFDLLVSEQAPPLTLAATQALVTAERGDLVAVGGEITGLHLESVAARFATLPPAASVLCPLGVLQRERIDHDFLAEMLMRFDLRPHWAHHDYFWVEFSPATDGTSTP